MSTPNLLLLCTSPPHAYLKVKMGSPGRKDTFMLFSQRIAIQACSQAISNVCYYGSNHFVLLSHKEIAI